MGKVHQQECLSAVERVFEDGLSMKGDFIAINFFALVFLLGYSVDIFKSEQF